MTRPDLSFIDLIAVPTSVHDAHGRFLHMNAGAEVASGRKVSEMLGRHVTDLVVPEARANVQAQFDRALAGHPVEFETAFTEATGEIRAARALHLPLRDGDDVVGVLILAFDVTAHRPDAFSVPPPALTRRQSQILYLISAGNSTDEIAAELGLSVETVRNHVRNLFRALNVHTRLEAIALAHRLGLLSPPPLGPKE